MATTTPSPSKTAPLIAMADPFLTKPATDRRGVQARNQALAGWIKRVLEKHGPLEPSLLGDAAGELGFTHNQVKHARLAAGIVAYTIPGSGAGKGKGQNPTFAALPHQVPEGATQIGLKPKSRELGVQSEAQEPLEHPIGENNGTGPEPREEPVQEPEPSGIPGLGKLPADWTGPLSAPLRPSGEEAKVSALPQDGDVSAAAQLLLSSLGLKTMDPSVVLEINAVRESLNQASQVIVNCLTRLARIEQGLS